MAKLEYTLPIAVLLLAMGTAVTATTAQLADGSVVDMGSPGSKVYIIDPDGNRHPLWNGVHQLNNGAQLTIRNGVMVTEPWSPGGQMARTGRCQTLVDKVCGTHGQCSEATACDLARQLVDMEAREEPGVRQGSSVGAQCDTALRDEDYFKPCD